LPASIKRTALLVQIRRLEEINEISNHNRFNVKATLEKQVAVLDSRSQLSVPTHLPDRLE
jgi:hypothetical protein